jgi:hypothetical protein
VTVEQELSKLLLSLLELLKWSHLYNFLLSYLLDYYSFINMLFCLSYLEILTGSTSPPPVWNTLTASDSTNASLDDKTMASTESMTAKQAVQHGSNSLAENPETPEGNDTSTIA